MAVAVIPRRLSDPEYVQFLDDVDLGQLNLPPWGAVVRWNGLEVLVFEAPGGVFLTDITGMNFNIPPAWEYNALAQTWIWHLPQELAAQALHVVESVGTGVQFTLGNLGPILAIAVGLFVFMELRKVSG